VKSPAKYPVKYLVDANVLSEPTKPGPDPRAVQWLRDHESDLATSPIVLGELEYGILLLVPGRKRTRLQEWFAQGAGRIRTLDFDAPTASAWAALLARLKRKGLAMPIKDSLVAATALAHRLTVATRNTRDFAHAAVPFVNPFEP
jgi:toxin FitB